MMATTLACKPEYRPSARRSRSLTVVLARLGARISDEVSVYTNSETVDGLLATIFNVHAIATPIIRRIFMRLKNDNQKRQTRYRSVCPTFKMSYDTGRHDSCGRTNSTSIWGFS